MAKKRTREDVTFAKAFTAALMRKWDQSRRDGTHTDETFARSVGIDRSSLYQYRRRPQVPSIRTVAMALEHHGIAIPYDVTDLRRVLPRRPSRRESAQQLSLPLRIEAVGDNRVAFSVTGVRPSRLDFSLTLGKSSGRRGA